MKPKLLVIGYAGHGKDTLCALLRNYYGLSFVSSSYFVGEKAVRPYLANKGISYSSIDECYADRVNHRADWFDAIALYNKDDPAKLGKELFAEHDIYCGLRRREELEALKRAGSYDYSIWIDASLRLPPEAESSCSVHYSDANFIINNNGPEQNLLNEIYGVMTRILGYTPTVPMLHKIR